MVTDTVTILDCELPARYSETDGDCDDSEASIYHYAPGSQEGLDNNCNGVIDPQEHPSFLLFRLFQVLFKVANVEAQCPNGDLNLPN